MSDYIPRIIEQSIQQALKRGKSILLLGPRQTGKTTLVNEEIKPDISYSFAKLSTRQRYEKDPALLEYELEEKIKTYKKPPLIFIDEIQKIPRIMDMAQYLIDAKQAHFILSGSSARKLKQGSELNLLPGRVISLVMSPLLYEELPEPKPSIEDLLLYGSLPHIITESDNQNKETDLYSYVSTYLEEEVRAEALVRNVGSFSSFLTIAAGESGKVLNATRLSQDIGVSDTTIKNYYQILEDCLIVHRIDPISNHGTKRRLIRSPRYLFFDLGVRRACANEGSQLPLRMMGDLFEHYVGNQLISYCQLKGAHHKVRYWKDSAGPEIDFVLEIEKQFVPIEVKWTDKPTEYDVRHIKKFLEEYPETQKAYVVCRTPHRYKILENVMAIPWQEMVTLF